MGRGWTRWGQWERMVGVEWVALSLDAWPCLGGKKSTQDASGSARGHCQRQGPLPAPPPQPREKLESAGRPWRLVITDGCR